MFGRVLAMLAITGCTSAPAPESPPAATLARPDMESICAGKTDWVDPGPPVPIFGNTYHVGTCAITVLLVTTPQGHVLIDAAPEAAAPAVLENIRKLGLDPRDVKWIASSHEHFDHSGGLAALKAATGAKVAANVAEVAALESGKPYPQDPQSAWLDPAAPVAVDRAMRDGDTLAIGGTVMTMHATPAHAPGSTSWTWTSCQGADCKRMAYLDSVSTPAPDSYRFSDHADYTAGVRNALEKMTRIPCDILLTPHPGQSAMYERYAGKAPLADPESCAGYARRGLENFDKLIARETTGG